MRKREPTTYVGLSLENRTYIKMLVEKQLYLSQAAAIKEIFLDNIFYVSANKLHVCNQVDRQNQQRSKYSITITTKVKNELRKLFVHYNKKNVYRYLSDAINACIAEDRKHYECPY